MAIEAPDEAPETPAATLPGTRPEPRPRRGRWRGLLGALALGAVLGGLPAARYLVPRTVTGTPVTRGPLVLTVSGPGTLDALTSADLATRIAGRLVAVTVALNDPVTQGQTVAEVDAAALREEVAQAVATKAAATKSIAQAQAALVQAEVALRKADDDLARSTSLLGTGGVSRSDHETRLATQRQAQAEVAQLKAALEVTRAQAASAAAALAGARVQLNEATVRAPFAGIVTGRPENTGDFVAAGTPIVRIVDPSSIVLTARFDESLIATLAAGQPARLRFVSEPGRVIAGRVLRLDRSVDGETREFTADITLDALPRNWAIGQRGDATVTVGTRPDVLTLPEALLVRRDGRVGVWLDRHGRAAWQPVETGAHGGGRVEITRGLAPGEIAVSGPRIFAGMRLRVAARTAAGTREGGGA